MSASEASDASDQSDEDASGLSQSTMANHTTESVQNNALSVGYRTLAHDYKFPRDSGSEQPVIDEILSIKTFWNAHANQLPTISALAFEYAFLVCSSAGVERSFTFYNKFLEEERQRMDSKTLKYLLFMC